MYVQCLKKILLLNLIPLLILSLQELEHASYNYTTYLGRLHFKVIKKINDDSAGVPEENIKAAQDGFTTLEIKVEGNDYTVTSAFGTRTFPLGKEIDETVGPGVLKVSALR